MTNIIYETYLCPDPELPLLLHDCLIDGEVLPHWHRNIELLYMIEGQMSVTIDSTEVLVSPGDIILINSDCLHSIKTISETSHYRCLIIEESFIAKHGMDYTKTIFPEKIQVPVIVALYQDMVTEFDAHLPSYKLILQAYCLQMIGLLTRQFENEEVKKEAKHTKIVLAKLGIDYISQHYQDSVSIDDICKSIGVSKFHFCRVFKEVTQLTVNEFINHFRCTRARMLLVQNNTSIVECALSCGFNDPSYFAKIYKKHFGYSPSEEVNKRQLV